MEKAYAQLIAMDAASFDRYNKENQEVIALALQINEKAGKAICLLYTSPSPRDRQKSRMPSSA